MCRLELEFESRDALMTESKQALADMAAQHAELLAALNTAHKEDRELRSALQAAMEEGRRRDGLVLRNKQLESARHFDRVAQVGRRAEHVGTGVTGRPYLI